LRFLVPVGAALAATRKTGNMPLTLVAGKPAPTGHESLLKCRSRTAPTRKNGHSVSKRIKGILRQRLTCSRAGSCDASPM
jgi:hypothetical protein